jgi:hypothetical protein
MDGAARLRLLQALQVFLLAVRRRRTEHATDRLLFRLGGLADPELRLHRFGEHLRARTPEAAARTLALLWDRVAAGDRPAQTVCFGLLDFRRLIRVLGAGRLEALQAILEAEGHPSAGLFASSTARVDLQDQEMAPRPKEPVGFRISLARRPVPTVVDRLLLDPDVRVIRTLLGNPRLTEADVVKVAASRHATAEVLEVIAEDGRWIGRYPVKVALASNPMTPLRVVVGLLPYLLQQDLRAMADGSSRAEVREQAAALLSRRSGGRTQSGSGVGIYGLGK